MKDSEITVRSITIKQITTGKDLATVSVTRGSDTVIVRESALELYFEKSLIELIKDAKAWEC